MPDTKRRTSSVLIVSIIVAFFVVCLSVGTAYAALTISTQKDTTIGTASLNVTLQSG